MPLDSTARILLVDDDYTVVEIIRSFLENLGFPDVEIAGDGNAALEILRAKPVSLIVSDVKMEPLGGLSLLREVRRDAKLRHIPFLLTTASSSPEFVINAKKAGVDGYLIKPFTKNQLLARIDTIRNLQRRTIDVAEDDK